MQKTSLNHLRLILYIMSTFLPLVIYQQVSCQDQTIPLPIQDSPQIPIIQENLAINDISYLMQPEDQPLTTKINEQKNAQPKDAITQNNSKKKRLTETNKKKALRKEKKEKRKKEKALRKKKHPEQEQKSNTALDFCVENKTGKTIYIVCFSYMKKNQFRRWHWNKSNTYMLDDNKTTTIAIPHINDEQDKANIFGYLAIFDNQKDAEESIFELLHDKNKIELDLLIHLNRKKVVLEVEKYGIVGDFFDYDFVFKKQEANHKIPELDFVVENQTGKTTHIACFVFQKKAKGTWLAKKTKATWASIDESRDDMSVWRFDKTPLLTLKQGESGIINVDTIVEPRDRSEVRGYLAVFDEDEYKDAEMSIFELLEPQKKLSLGKLATLKDQKVILKIEQYGTAGNLIDFTAKPIKRIEFDKIDQALALKKPLK